MTIQIRRDILTDEQKEKLAHDIMGLLLQTDPEIGNLDINVVFQETDKHSWWVRQRAHDEEDDQPEDLPDEGPGATEQPKITYCTREL